MRCFPFISSQSTEFVDQETAAVTAAVSYLPAVVYLLKKTRSALLSFASRRDESIVRISSIQ